MPAAASAAKMSSMCGRRASAAASPVGVPSRYARNAALGAIAAPVASFRLRSATM
jgi:hypothetical protein